MSNALVCPNCGSTRAEAHQDSNAAVSHSSRKTLQFAQVLNGRQWREKPIAPPFDRDDLVPSD